MRKRVFILSVVLMSLALIGIISVQVYLINNSLANEERNFTLSATRALSYTSKEVAAIEMQQYMEKVSPILESGKLPDSTAITELYVSAEDDINDRTIVHRNILLEEHFKLWPSTIFEIDTEIDTISIFRLSNERITEIYNTSKIDGNIDLKPKQTFKEYSQMPELRRQALELSFKKVIKEGNIPIHKRVSKTTIKDLLKTKLKDEGINLDFEFSIYDDDLATKIQTEDFNKDYKTTLGIPVLLDDNGETDYTLYVDFPDRKKYIFSSVLWMVVLSVIFTAVILLAYSSAIYQLVKQRQISQIKTDFINNMTHEFKTPIATINLALDAIKNPQIIGDEEKVKRYLGMIKDENKRMHAQVENVLRISKLEKNELNISKERIKLHDLVEDAITHVQLIVEDRKGYIKTKLDAVKSSVLANETHFTNVIVNILDNAIKYSDDEPKIDVETENVGNNIVLKIADQGNGMSKQVAKRVFEKFYREHTGNVHNVKGHGLGLAYVKRIVDDHQGHISVESEKGKGSTFIVRLPLIS